MSAVSVPALASSSLPVESKALHLLPLEEVAQCLQSGLQANFSDASVEVVDCPDLTQSPWSLASKGLCGSPRLLDIGGVPFLMPLVQREKLYDMADYPRLTGSHASGLVIGAGAGPWPHLNRNAEMMPNLFVNSDSSILQETRITRTHDEDGSYSTLKLPSSETRNAVLGNVFICDGEPGKVLRIRATKRTGSNETRGGEGAAGGFFNFLYKRRKEFRNLHEGMFELCLP